jgi:peptide/nickel transport system substrate-binding protein
MAQWQGRRNLMRLALSGAAILTLAGGGVGAADLIIATKATPAVDPHYFSLATNHAYNRHIFGALVDQDDTGNNVPGLAERWELVEPNRWRFHLRKDVKFHNGAPMTAKDVVYTFDRIRKVPNNPGPYTSSLQAVKEFLIIDDHTIDVITTSPNMTIPGQFARIAIVSADLVGGGNLGTADFLQGKAAIGAGPYKFASYAQGQSLVLTANKEFWGKAPEWDKVTFRIIPNDASRVAALLNGEVDVADFVPASSLDAVRASPNLKVVIAPSDRIMSLVPNVGPLDKIEGLADANGKPLDKNPYADVRVREALSLALDRKTLTERVLGGLGFPANQPMPPGAIGYVEERPGSEYSVEKAKALLAAAGYPNGFQTSIACTNDRFSNDARVCQALGQMLTRIGLKVTVITQPSSIIFSRAKVGDNAYPLLLHTLGLSGVEAFTLPTLYHTPDPARGLGVQNRSGYSDAKLDGMISTFLAETDMPKRIKLQEEAVGYATETYTWIPIYYEGFATGARKNIAVDMNISQFTLAYNIHAAR